MITRFYVDNYKCLVNFEYKPKPMELIIGGNGSGKTTVFEALDKVRQFLNEEADVSEIFPLSSRTRWSSKTSQIFEIDFQDSDTTIYYRLEVDTGLNGSYVEKETIKYGKNTVMESFWRKFQTFRMSSEKANNLSKSHKGEMRYAKIVDDETEYPLSNPDGSINAMSEWLNLKDAIFLKVNPPLIDSQIRKMEPRLVLNGDNFGSYHLYTLQQKQGRMFDVISQLREVLPGFDSFSVEEDFEEGRRELNVNFKGNADARTKRSSEMKFSFDELSDGQRALIVLYTLVLCEVDAGKTIVIDEPENYIGLRELQPLILLMEERVRETGGQILLISHNREFINMLTDRGLCTRFYRENNGHTRIAAFNPDSELAPAEIIASGMEDDE